MNCTRSQAVAALRKNGNDIVSGFCVVVPCWPVLMVVFVLGECDYVTQLKNKLFLVENPLKLVKFVTSFIFCPFQGQSSFPQPPFSPL